MTISESRMSFGSAQTLLWRKDIGFDVFSDKLDLLIYLVRNSGEI